MSRGSAMVAPSQRPWLRSVANVTAVAALGLLTVAMVLLGKGSAGVAVAPVAAAAALYVVWKAPLRWTALGLSFLLLTLDDHMGGGQLWRSPLATLGDLLRYNIDMTFTSTKGVMKFSGMELILALMFVVALRRSARHETIDSAGAVATASVLRDGVVMYFLALAYGLVVGMMHGGTTEIAIWQVRPFIHVGILFLFYQAAFRGPLDHGALAKLIVLTALLRAALAVYVVEVAAPARGMSEDINTATSHGDSVLFTVACVILIVDFLERPVTGRFLNLLLFVPPIFWGMLANNRRLAWVELALALLAVYFVSRPRGWKRAITRLAVASTPIVLLYVAAGWNAGGGGAFFAPVRTLRSVVDAKTDRSAWDRETENWNLAASMADRPIMGRGFGLEWTEVYKMDDITKAFPQYHAEPHNQILGLLLFGGLPGFVGVWGFLSLGAFLAARAYRHARTAEERVAALCCLAVTPIILAQSYGDLGHYWIHSKVISALSLAVAGKLAVATGAWPARLPRPWRSPSSSREGAPTPGGVA